MKITLLNVKIFSDESFDLLDQGKGIQFKFTHKVWPAGPMRKCVFYSNADQFFPDPVFCHDFSNRRSQSTDDGMIFHRNYPKS